MAEVERNWFRNALGGAEPVPIYYSDDDPDGDFDNVDDADIEQDLAVWRAECDHSRALLASIDSLDFTGTRRGDPRGEAVSARWVLTHMIEEYARHNGHADLLRERVDGSTGD
jgi:hypothetical protein